MTTTPHGRKRNFWYVEGEDFDYLYLDLREVARLLARPFARPSADAGSGTPEAGARDEARKRDRR